MDLAASLKREAALAFPSPRAAFLRHVLAGDSSAKIVE